MIDENFVKISIVIYVPAATHSYLAVMWAVFSIYMMT